MKNVTVTFLRFCGTLSPNKMLPYVTNVFDMKSGLQWGVDCTHGEMASLKSCVNEHKWQAVGFLNKLVHDYPDL